LSAARTTMAPASKASAIAKSYGGATLTNTGALPRHNHRLASD
jgi:hypothetical protein